MTKTSINIILDRNPSSDGSASFVPGQTVSGRVNFSVHARKVVDAIDIVFEGQCYTHMMTTTSNGLGIITRHYKENIPLFEFSQSLFQGPYTIQPTTGELSWPFNFTLPEASNFTRKKRNGHAEQWNQGPQPLPPSIDINYIYDCKVTYHLTAILNPSSFVGSQKTELPIRVTPVSKQPLPVPVSQPHLSGLQHYRSNSLRLQQHTFKQKMAHIFTSNPTLKTPSIIFVPEVYIPSGASIWQYLPLSISIQHQPSGPTDPPNPTLIIQRLILQLKQYTFVLVDSLATKGKSVVSKLDLTVGRKLPLDNTPLEISNTQGSNNDGAVAIRLADMAKGTELPVPSFSTYTIIHSYKIKLEIVIQHPETLHQFRFETKTDFKVLPPFMGNM